MILIVVNLDQGCVVMGNLAIVNRDGIVGVLIDVVGVFFQGNNVMRFLIFNDQDVVDNGIVIYGWYGLGDGFI